MSGNENLIPGMLFFAVGLIVSVWVVSGYVDPVMAGIFVVVSCYFSFIISYIIITA